jgi:hypothetical protein
MTACAVEANASDRRTVWPASFTIAADGAYAARLRTSTEGGWYPERWTLDGPEPYAIPLPGPGPEEPGSQVLPLTDGRVLIARHGPGRWPLALLYPTGPGTGEICLGVIESERLTLLPPAPCGRRGYALVPGERSTGVWLLTDGAAALPRRVAEVPGRCSGGAWLDRWGRLLAVDRTDTTGTGRTKTVVVDLGRGGEISPLLQITADSDDRLLLADPDSGLLLVSSNAPGEERLGWGVLGSERPIRFPSSLRPRGAVLTPFAVQPGQALLPEHCGVALRGQLAGPATELVRGPLREPDSESVADSITGRAAGVDLREQEGSSRQRPLGQEPFGPGSFGAEAFRAEAFRAEAFRSGCFEGGSFGRSALGPGTLTQGPGAGRKGRPPGGSWLAVWNPARGELRNLPAPAGWLPGQGVWTSDGELRLPCVTPHAPCGLARLRARPPGAGAGQGDSGRTGGERPYVRADLTSPSASGTPSGAGDGGSGTGGYGADGPGTGAAAETGTGTSTGAGTGRSARDGVGGGCADGPTAGPASGAMAAEPGSGPTPAARAQPPERRVPRRPMPLQQAPLNPPRHPALAPHAATPAGPRPGPRPGSSPDSPPPPLNPAPNPPPNPPPRLPLNPAPKPAPKPPVSPSPDFSVGGPARVEALETRTV